MPHRAVIHHDWTLEDALAAQLHDERERRLTKCAGGTRGAVAAINPWRQAAVARRIGVSPQRLNQWERGRSRPPTFSAWPRWSSAYQLDLARMLDDIERERRRET